MLTRAPGWTATRRAYTLTNRGRHPLRDVFVVHVEGARRMAFFTDAITPERALTFTLDESSHDVCLTITVPERARDAAELFFEPFLTSEAPPATAAHCARPANGCCS